MKLNLTATLLLLGASLALAAPQPAADNLVSSQPSPPPNQFYL